MTRQIPVPAGLELRTPRTAQVKDAARVTKRFHGWVNERVALARTRRCVVLGATLLALFVPLSYASSAEAASPEWKLTVTPSADYFLPGAFSGNSVYTIEAENVGGEATHDSEQIVLEDTPPAGFVAEGVHLFSSGTGVVLTNPEDDLSLKGLCPSLLKCEFPGPLAGSVPDIGPGQRLIMQVRLAVPPASPQGPVEDAAAISGGGAPSAQAVASNQVDATPGYGFHSFSAAVNESACDPIETPEGCHSYTQAGGHPYQFSTEFNLDTVTSPINGGGPWGNAGVIPVRNPRSLTGELPPGLIANPQGVPRCALAAFFANECPISTVVGDVGLNIFGGYHEGRFVYIVPLFNLQPAGAYPGELGYEVAGPTFPITAGVRTGSDYGITATSEGILPVNLIRARVTVWGVPADHSHDALRGKRCPGTSGGLIAWNEIFANSQEQVEGECEAEAHAGGPFPNGGPAEVPPTPFVTMPTECSGQPLAFGARSVPWEDPAEEATASATSPAVDGCNALGFEPTIEARPTTNLADSPSGLEVNLEVPQNHAGPEGREDPNGVATPSLKEAVVKLPPGLTVNPSSGNGLRGCSPAQIGLTTPAGQTPAHFTESPAQCPDASKIGVAEVDTPLLHEPLGSIESLPGRVGDVFLATPHQNPFNSLLAAYIVLEGQGLIIKLPGQIELDHQTGQITGKFLENPQTPFEGFHLRFFGGAQGDLRTPAVCGTYETAATLTPYSAPESGPPAEPSAEFETTAGPCSRRASAEPNAPVFHAGTESTQAGAYSPFSLKLVREDGSQELAKIDTTLPPGLVGKLAGVGECSEAQLAAAAAPSRSGTEEQAAPSCPASTEVGTVDVGAGAGPTPLYVTGHAYLAGPYKGAPLSLAIITPAVAGPFDLGTVVVRTALYVDPFTAQIHAVSDEIPHILEGIPLDVRSITLQMNRPNFTLNPTNCNELGFTGAATSLLGNVAPLAQRFQVGGCSALKFKPSLKLSLKGSTKRTGHPALKAVLTAKPGEANIHSAQVTLPHSAFLEQAHIRTICTNVQFNANQCPAGSIYGRARAITPLLDKPLEGNVYLRSSSHQLPDLVANLDGQIHVVLDGKVDSINARLRNTFEAVPDAPVSKFILEMQGGKKGLIVNSENLCSPQAKTHAIVAFTGQNGKTYNTEPTVANSCKKKGKGKHGKGHKHHKSASHRLGTTHR